MAKGSKGMGGKGKGGMGGGGKRACLVALALALTATTGCSTIKALAGASLPYDVTLIASGAVEIPNTKLGSIALPETGVSLAELGLGLASAYLAQTHDWKNCNFQLGAKTTAGDAVTIAATAACTFQGSPVAESVAVTFTPA